MLRLIHKLLGGRRCPECETLIDYAMDGLDSAQAAKVKDHLLACPSCMEQMRDFLQVNEGLALGAPEAQAPDGLCGRVKARIAAEASRLPAAPASPSSSALNGWPLFWLRLGPVFAGLSLMMTFVALSALLTHGPAEEPVLAEAHSLLRDPQVRRVELVGQGKRRSCQGRLWLARGRDALLVRTGKLHPCPRGRSYVIWMEPSQGPRQRLAGFQLEAEGEIAQWLHLARPLEVQGPVALKVTLEDARLGGDAMRGELALSGRAEF